MSHPETYAPTSVLFDPHNSTGPYGTPEQCLFTVRADLGWIADADEILKLADWLDNVLEHSWAREVADQLREGLVSAQGAARWHFGYEDSTVTI